MVIIDHCDYLQLNSFLYRYFHWSLKHDPSSSTFPNRFVYADQQIFVNSSFRLICNFTHFHRNSKFIDR